MALVAINNKKANHKRAEEFNCQAINATSKNPTKEPALLLRTTKLLFKPLKYPSKT